jgi:hypothetical protein
MDISKTTGSSPTGYMKPLPSVSQAQTDLQNLSQAYNPGSPTSESDPLSVLVKQAQTSPSGPGNAINIMG